MIKKRVSPQNGELSHKLTWIMLVRLLFSSLLLGSTIIMQLSQSLNPLAEPLLMLYELIAGIFLLSFCYAASLRWFGDRLWFAMGQVLIDTVIVTLIIFVTGGYTSIFSFMYLIVIIYSSILLTKSKILLVALLSAMQYGLLVLLEYRGSFMPYMLGGSMSASAYPLSQIFYKLAMTVSAYIAVAVLSGLLSEQATKSRRRLHAMEEKVKRIEKMAAVGEMGAGLAHEIKNPLASMIGSIQLLREDLPPDHDHDMLMQIILREADRLSALVNNFLLFARPPAGKKEPLALGPAVAEILVLFSKNLKREGQIELIQTLASDVWVSLDPDHLHQIMWNLLLNSAESIEETGAISVVVQTRRNNKAEIRISDTGGGIHRDVISTIFDPFITTKPKGTGLGLSVVHSILEHYGSYLEVESEFNMGTTVWFRLEQIPTPSTA